MTLPFSTQTIAQLTNSHPIDVELIWPRLQKHLDSHAIDTTNNVVVMAATAGCESHFRIVREQGDAAYFQKTYGKRSDYVVDSEGLWKWRGRGIIQLTGEDNYIKYGKLLGVDLQANPDKALAPDVAADVFFEYMRQTNCFTWAGRGHWLEIRYIVNGHKPLKPNGGYNWPNGWEAYETYIYKLLSEAYR